MIAANILWNKLNSRYFQTFLQFCKCNIAQESTLRETCLNECYHCVKFHKKIQDGCVLGSSAVWSGRKLPYFYQTTRR
jgi:hypothetical protein